MSESIVRKIQPFTIGTKLSAPAVPKCPSFTFSDDCKLQRRLNEQVSLYLGRSQVYDRRPATVPVTPVNHQQEEMSDQDHLNTVSPNAASRSIRKITISGSVEAGSSPETELKINPNSENINNNNNITNSKTVLPKIVGVSCENKPNSHLKVLLCKDAERQRVGDREKISSFPQTHLLKTRTTGANVLKVNTPSSSSEHKDVSVVTKVSAGQNDHSVAQQNVLFNREITQAEIWIRGRLRDLRDSSNVQRCLQKDWDEACQTLQRDLKDFENTLVQLNQMGEQLMCKLNPTSDLVRKRLAQLRDQWGTLKQTTANQIKAMGGAKSLQEFNVKVDRLEAWIKEKEEERTLANILGENIDKMQLTRKILDLKQDEQLYRNLHEEINHVALRLEKQGKTDGKTISTRRKHINKMWLKAQSHLKDYHENLQLALDVSSFYQQADNIICSINNMRKSLSRSNGAGEIRDIASQIMMLDVTVSQLSNLHPALAARVTQKQSEMKDCWALFQKTVRTEKAAQLPSAPSLTRESRDPQTPSREPPGSVGTDPGRIMGKEVKEEQNRLKGFTGGRDIERYRKPSESQDDPQQTAVENSTRSPTSDVIVRLQTSIESRNPASSESRGHPALQTQLQKFTASADKTLSWLKESIAMATQICNLSGPHGLEVAKRRQTSLDQDIRSNRARIELVKREGHSLVRAEHPGSSRIQEFVSELEVLWDELIRRHQRNALVLQVSEELNHKVVRVLQSLCSLEAWLEAVELSIRQASLAGDPESVSVAEQESSHLERELEARGLELRDLRQEVDHLSSNKHLHTQLLPGRLKEVEEKFSSVQTALTQQSSELKDTRMLTEFLEKVELEESQYSTLGQPLCSDVDSGPSPLGLPGSTRGEPLMETIGNPVKELREAVEMLNDTARERGRSRSHNQNIQDLLSKHSEFSARVERCLQRSSELAVDVLEMESEMAVRCEPDRCGLDRLQEIQDQLEAEYEMLREQVEVMESQAERLSDVCLERMHGVSAEIQSSLNSWDELVRSVAENRKRLLQFEHLRSFFRNYLAMISWTEDTRSCIFSESARRQSRENRQPLVEVLDQKIEQKFEEFDRLVVAGKKLFDAEHHLNKMIGERMEELRSMLGWILVHWRAQKNQLLTKKKAGDARSDAIYSELETSPDSQKSIEQVTCAPPADPEERLQHSDAYEVMKSVSPRGSEVISSSERPDSPYLVLKGPSPPALGGTVNLILSFSNSGDTQLQVQTPGGEEGAPEPEPVHRPAESYSSARKSFWKRCQGLFGSLKRKKKLNGHSAEEVSTYLHVTDNSVAVAPVYESMTLPRNKSQRSSFSSSCTFPYSSSCNEDALKQSNNSSIHLLSKNTNISIFSSLKRKRKKKKDDRWHTIQKIMGEEVQAGPTHVCEPAVYETWPLKERRKRKDARKPNSDGAQVLDYMKNPLEKDIDAESSGEVESPVRCEFEDPKVSSRGHVKNHCRFLSLGSVLSFDLPKDMSLIPSIQDVITIGPAEGKKTSCDLQEFPTALSTFKTARSVPTRKEEPKHTSSGEITLRIDCKDARNISIGTDVSFTEDEFPPPPSPVIEDISFEGTDIQMNRLSGISKVTQEEQCSWDAHETHFESKDFNVCPPDDAANQSSTTAEIHTLLHKPGKTSQLDRESPIPLQASHVVLNFKTSRREDSVDSGHSSSGSFKLDTSDCSASKKIVKLPSMDTNISSVKKFESSQEKTPSVNDSVHPDHQQFEQEEEELEDIWNHTNSYRQSVCSDIMYSGYQTCSPDQQRAPSPKEQAVLCRKLVTASAPNLLVAEFRLPQSVQPAVGCGTWQNSKEETCIDGRRDRRSWAAFTQQEQVYKQVAVNETASDPMRLPVVEHQNKYIYHYKEEEEEEEEEEDGFLKDQSGGLLSRQMVLDGSANDFDIQNEKQELASMEGTLERKQKLQLGGKRASCRGWSSYHAVLYKRTMCFYQDRKDALKSLCVSLPLNLIGAVCEPSPEYTKRPNCFCLRLRDGSEYLLSASSRFMMRKWILRIQEHAACSESGVNISARHNPSADASPLRCSPQTDSSHRTDECQSPVRSFVSSTVLAQSQSTSGRSREIIVHTGDGLHIHQRHQELLSISSSHAGHCEDEFRSHGQNVRPTGVHSSSVRQGWTGEKRRSHSFTSATYQRIKPVLPPPTGRDRDNSSSYSVTLFIGDRETTSAMAEPKAVGQGSSCDVPLLSYMSLPRPRNKSVFRKFFGKKE